MDSNLNIYPDCNKCIHRDVHPDAHPCGSCNHGDHFINNERLFFLVDHSYQPEYYVGASDSITQDDFEAHEAEMQMRKEFNGKKMTKEDWFEIFQELDTEFGHIDDEGEYQYDYEFEDEDELDINDYENEELMSLEDYTDIEDEDAEFEYDGNEPYQHQVGGNHYGGKIQPVEFIMANDIPYCEGNVIKYVFRHKMKNGLEDLMKARQYLDFLIKEYEQY